MVVKFVNLNRGGKKKAPSKPQGSLLSANFEFPVTFSADNGHAKLSFFSAENKKTGGLSFFQPAHYRLRFGKC
jgi:hypothetical protein